MTSLQLLDRLAFCIGYVVMGMAILGAAAGFCLMLFDWLVIIFAGRHDRNEDPQDD